VNEQEEKKVIQAKQGLISSKPK